MPYSEADLKALQTAIASGVLTVRYENRTVTYQSLKELRELEESLARALQPSRPRQTIVVGQKGFC